jgi:hypothetical protein
MRKVKVVQMASPMMLLPPHPSKCQECAAEHEPDQPHNAQTLFYQVKFQMDNGRGATWIDAMAHCSPEMRALWTAALIERGVDVAGGEINPSKKAKTA